MVDLRNEFARLKGRESEAARRVGVGTTLVLNIEHYLCNER